MKLIVTKTNQDLINGGVVSITVGVFDDDGGTARMEFYVPRKNILQTIVEIRVGQELKLVPVEAK